MLKKSCPTAAIAIGIVCAVLVMAQATGVAQRKAAPRWFAYEHLYGGAPRPAAGAPQEEITVPLPAITEWLDDEHYLESRADPADKRRKTFAVSIADGTATLYQDPDESRGGVPPDYQAAGMAADRSGILLTKKDDLYFYQTATKSLRQLTSTPAAEQYPRLSPNGKLVVYTRDHDLFIYELQAGVERQITADGSDSILNGYSSWVYMEEILGRGEGYGAYWWSPDSTKLAFLRFDDSPVPVFPIYHAGRKPYEDPTWQHGTLELQRYPKAGDPNPYVQMGVVNVADGAITWMDFDPKADHYLAWPYWTPDSRKLLVQWMNRGQDTLRFFACDPSTGTKSQILEQRSKTWIDFYKDLHWLQNGKAMLLRSDADGWEHLYIYGADGSMKTRLTTGAFRVRSIQSVDEKNGYVYFTANPTQPWDLHLMRAKLDGSGMEQITKGEGRHRAVVSPNGKYFVDSVTTIANPGTSSLFAIDGTLVRKLGDAKGKDFDKYAWGRGEMFSIKSDDGQFDLPAYWVLPPGCDPTNPKSAKQYPVVFSIYGGPDSGSVSNSWKGNGVHYWAQRGVITISVDHRGGGAFGRRGIDAMHRNLGKWEMADLISAAKWLRTRPFVAKEKIGIAGGSYGGYTTMMALFYGAGHFNYGQAGSSVSAWELYDTVYTERYMDTPKENPEGYMAAAVLTYADRYKGGLKIDHGTIDDNVHMQNSTQVVDWLVSNDKSFEFMFYPESRHGYIAAQRAHSGRSGHDYWVKTLLDGMLPQPPTSK